MESVNNTNEHQEIPKFEINPLMREQVTERSYTGGDINHSDNDDIPEYSPAKEIEGPESFENQQPKEPLNESYNELPNKEKKQGAELAADTLLDAYSGICSMGVKVVSISEKRIQKEYAEGTIDPDLRLPTQDNSTVSVMEYAESFNATLSEAFEVSSDFKEKVKEPLVRVLQKRGLAMSDEQFLMYAFGKDLGEKVLIAVSLKLQTKEMLSMLREQTDQLKKNSIVYNPEPDPAPEYKAQPTAEERAPLKPEIVQVTDTKPKSVAKERLAKAQDGKKKESAEDTVLKEPKKESATKVFIKKTEMKGAEKIGTPMSKEDLERMEKVAKGMTK